MEVVIFCAFGLKTLIHFMPPKLGSFVIEIATCLLTTIFVFIGMTLIAYTVFNDQTAVHILEMLYGIVIGLIVRY